MATGFEGNDPDALDHTAAQIDRLAAELETGSSRLGQAMHGLYWDGPSGARFRHDWAARASSARVLANHLHESSRTLRENARQQREASAAAGGTIQAGGGGGAGGGGRSLDPGAAIPLGWDALDLPFKVVSGVDFLVGGAAKLFEKHGSHVPGFLKAVAGPLEKFSMVGGAIGIVEDGAHIVDAVKHHDLTAGVFAGADLVADGLKMVPGPETYLASAAIKLTEAACKEALLVDWSPQGMQAVSDAGVSGFIAALPQSVNTMLHMPDVQDAILP